MSDYLYVIRSTKGGPVKLGRATDVVKRLRTLQTGHPERLEVLWSALGDGDGAERALHQHFASKRSVGEWFNLTREDIASIPAVVARYTLAATSTPSMAALTQQTGAALAQQTGRALEAAQWAALTLEQQRDYQEKAAAVQSTAFRRQLRNVAIALRRVRGRRGPQR